jgi:hypothetical protein
MVHVNANAQQARKVRDIPNAEAEYTSFTSKNLARPKTMSFAKAASRCDVVTNTNWNVSKDQAC